MQSAQGGKGPLQPMVGVEVSGQYFPQPGDSPDGGSVTSYLGYTSKSKNPDATQGLYYVSNAMTDVYWDHQVWLPDVCAIPDPPVFLVDPGYGTDEEKWGVNGLFMTNTGQMKVPDPAEATWECLSPKGQPLPSLSSQFAFTGEIPTSVTMAGWHPYTTANGMPEMYVFSGAGGTSSFYTEIDAASVDTSGATATFDLPSNMPQNAYAFEVMNQNADGTVQHQGFNYFTAARSQTIPGNPFGVAVNAQTETIQTCKWYPGPYLWCGPQTSSFSTTPVISLYSQNQVLIGSTAVTVGANPTAVLTYNGGVVHEGWSPNTDDFTGTTRAIVADSGTNLVSILDTVADRLLENVIVGNQPVALAVSSDATKAYVANYADSTVTQVNLTAGTVLATVPVGGQPTSVALTSGGTLWVGGVGFLTEINTQNMSVVATESTAGTTIAALGFSDGENELIATSTTSGNVSIDELNPSAVQPGGTYTPLASHSVSTLGTYYNPRLQANVQGYTATVTTSTIPISTILPGAPPVVVQDGWAVVTATPTGFSITDVSGHVVLVSETTPSPVASIAVDSNLNVAYLTMPDSNTLLTVPLPGTGSN
ncbi:MAG TPA: YncE family protein [Terracidiphilus sp.]|nr:YncE family protein [Terracidiphilus sp.]